MYGYSLKQMFLKVTVLRRFCAGSNPARGVSKIRDGEYL